MKYAALSLFAAACGALSASALDATNARIWLEEKIQPDFTAIGSGIASDKHGTAPAYARNWQYVSIPLHVEGAVKSSEGKDAYPHYIPELKVRISIALTTTDAKGKPTGTPELLTKEITYVDIPLAKHPRKPNLGEGVVNVGVFVSPSDAFNLSAKDGSLSKKIIAVAVEGTFKGSPCNRVKEKANDNVETAVVVNTKEGKNLATKWWTKQGGNGGGTLAAISETPFAHDYARLGFPATNPLFGAPAVVAAPPVAEVPSTTGTEGGPTSVADDSSEVSHSADDDTTSVEDEESTKGKRGRKSSKRSRR